MPTTTPATSNTNPTARESATAATPKNPAPEPNVTTPVIQEFAVVEEVHHPLAILRGFPSILPGELVLFENNVQGQVFSFDEDKVNVMVFDSRAPMVGSSVVRTNQVLSFPVSDRLLGTMLNPLGTHLLGKEPSKIHHRRLLDSPPPHLDQRHRIHRRLHCGVSLVDILLPIGQGQRELILGDRKTGKSAFVVTTAATQAQNDSIIIYALIGKKTVEIRQLYDTFAELGILEKMVIVASAASDPVSTIVQTPYSAMAIAEYFRDQGQNVLVIFDDLSQHAKFYRELSLLAKDFPGRDSYPGNIFSIHAQLLERAGCFNHPKDPNDSVAITCLPMAETTDSDLTEYIVSNLISITDGHLLFDNTLFQQGQRPAVHTALSVTRVGKQTQSPLERDISRNVSNFVTKFEKIKELTHFGSELSDASQAVIHQGQTLMSFFAQAQRVTLPLKLQHVLLAIIWLGWIKKSDKQTVHDVINNLLSASDSSQEISERLDKVVEVKTFTEVLSKVNQERAFISTVCKI